MPTPIDVAIYDCWNVDSMNANAAQIEYDELKARLEAAEARAAELAQVLVEIREASFLPDGTRLFDAVKQVMQERDTLAQKLAAEEAAHQTDVAALREKLEQARKALAVISATVAGLDEQPAPVVKRSIKEIQGWTRAALS
jgi:hypothetical protein